MTATIEATKPANTSSGILSQTQKLASLLVMLGPESAAVILKQFQPGEVQAISREMARFNLFTRDQQLEVLSEFSNVAVSATPAMSTAIAVTETNLEQPTGKIDAEALLSRFTSTRSPVGAMQTIAKMNPRHIVDLLRNEGLQTVTFIISYLSAEKGGQVLHLLPEDQRNQVIERLAILEPTPVELAEKVFGVLNTKLGVKQARPINQKTGTTSLTESCNSGDEGVSRDPVAHAQYEMV
jgi:flagellar motor switch protein FliG